MREDRAEGSVENEERDGLESPTELSARAGVLKSVKERGTESRSHCSSAGARFARRACRGRTRSRSGAARRGVARRLPTRAFERAFSLTFLNATLRDRGRRSVPRRVPRRTGRRPAAAVLGATLLRLSAQRGVFLLFPLILKIFYKL